MGKTTNLLKKLLKKIWPWIWKTAVGFLILTNVWVLLYRWVNPPVTYLMVSKYIQDDREDREISYDWVDLEEISPHLQLAVICSEDQRFVKHNGISWTAVEKAIEDKKKGKKLRGASTITQQVAKNAFLWPGRSWVRKGLEVYFTYLVEFYWSKSRILEVYLNIIELGPGVYGAEAAAQKYFKRPAAQLTRSQAALMAVVLPNPIKMSLARPTSYMRNRRQWVIKQMRLFGGTGYLKRLEDA